MRIGVLTAGGDCPGLNAVIRSVVHRAVVGHGDEVIGFEDGFKGLLDGHFRPLDLNAVSGILAHGGTILGSARLERDRLREAAENCDELAPPLRHRRADPDRRRGHPHRGPDAVGRRNARRRRSEDHRQRHLRPPTAPSASTRRWGRHRSHRPSQDHGRIAPAGHGRRGDGPARGLDRPGVRHGGRRARHLSARAAVRGRRTWSRWSRSASPAARSSRSSASPRARTRPRARCRTPRARSTSSATSASRASATGSRSSWRRRLGKEARPVILGHVQRGGTPTAYDRVLATRFGWHAVEAAHRGDFGRMTALRGNDIKMVPLADAITQLKTVPKDRMYEAESVF